MAGAPAGNENRVKGKLFNDMLLRVVQADLAQPEKNQRLRRACQALLNNAATGDVPSLKELADRLDGKVAQVLAGDGDAPLRIVLSKDDSEL